MLRQPLKASSVDLPFPGFVYISRDQPLMYGVPPAQGLDEVKFGVEQNSVTLPDPNPALLPGNFVADTAATIVTLAGQHVPSVALKSAPADLCYYTVTQANKLTVQRFDAEGKITIVSACSGHGFKYAPAVAEQIIQHLVATI